MQWSPTFNTSTSGGDAVGDAVCQSGVTQSFRPAQTSNGTRTVCASLIDRAFAFSRSGSWFYAMRLTSSTYQMSCAGDSGGPVWRSTWLSGVVKGFRGTSNPDVNGQDCSSQLEYSHVGYIPAAFNLAAPNGFS